MHERHLHTYAWDQMGASVTGERDRERKTETNKVNWSKIICIALVEAAVVGTTSFLLDIL